MANIYDLEPFKPTRDFAQQFKCSLKTVRRALYRAGLHRRKPATEIILNEVQSNSLDTNTCNMYSEQDLINLYAIYQNCCKGDIQHTREVYASLYGTKPSMCTIKKAINTGIKRSQQLEQKPAAANNNKLIDCKFLEDSSDVTEEVTITDEKDDNSSNLGQRTLYTRTNVLKEVVSGTSTVLDSKLHQVPVVYTTRLNDMNIFKEDLNSLTVNNIMQSVIAESKPQLKQESQVKSKIFTNYSLSFDELLDKVELYNLFATSIDFGDFDITVNSTFNDSFHHQSCDDEGNATQKEFLHVCSPLSVVLTDCKIQCRNCYVKVKSLNPMVLKLIKCPYCNPPIDYTKKKEEEVIIRQDFDCQSVKIKNKNISNIVMKNLYSNTTDIYCFESGTAILKGYFHINRAICDDKELLKFINGNAITEYINCCWVNKNTKCKKLWSDLEYININRPPLFLLDSHPCPHNDCKCCCCEGNGQGGVITENNDTSLKISIEKHKYQSIRSQLLSITNRVKTDTWINKALKYSKKLKPQVTAEVAKPASIHGGFAVQIESNNHLEHYTVQNGKIDSYFEINSQSSKPYQSQINTHENVIKGSGCCWVSRDAFLSSKFKNCLKIPHHFVKTTHDIVNFFKTSHQCSIGSCSCCCKIRTNKDANFSKQFEQIELPTLLKKTSNYNISKHVQNLKLCKKPIRTDFSKSKNKTNGPKKQPNSSQPKNQTVNNKTNGPKKQPKSSQREKQTVKTSNPNRPKCTTRLLARPVISVPLLTQQNVELTVNKPENATDPLSSIQNPVILDSATNNPTIQDQTQDPVVETLISNVLERFKNICLTLNSEGKVVAKLDTPATNLSKTELEILSSILTRAQQQVNNLRMANHVTENFQLVMTNPSTIIPKLSVPENTNTLFSGEKQNTKYDNSTTNKNATTDLPLFVGDPLISKPANQEKCTSLLKEREKMESTVGSSTDLYHAFTNLTYLKNEQYRRSFSELTSKKHVQYNGSFESQKLNCASEPSSFGLKTKDPDGLLKNDKVANIATLATVSPTNLATPKNRVKRKSQTNSNSNNNSAAKVMRMKTQTNSNSNNNSAAKVMRMTPLTPVTSSVTSQTLHVRKILPYQQPVLYSPLSMVNVVGSQPNFSQPFVVYSAIPNMTQPVFIPAGSVLNTAPPIGEPLLRENNIMMGFLSAPKKTIFNDIQVASSSDRLEAENDEDDCILGV